MGLRERLSNTPIFGAIVVIVLLGVAAAVVMRKPADPAAGGIYYFDLKTGKVFAAARQTPPVQSPEGNPAVVAQVYTCGACEPSQWFVMIIETTQGNPPLLRVAAPPQAGAEPQWMDAVPISPETRRIVEAGNKRCGQAPPTHCIP